MSGENKVRVALLYLCAGTLAWAWAEWQMMPRPKPRAARIAVVKKAGPEPEPFLPAKPVAARPAAKARPVAKAKPAARRAPAASSDVSEELLYGIAMKESRGKANAVGDRHLRHKAYWLYQIRKPYLDDVQRIVGRSRMRELWGKPVLTMADLKDEKVAEWVVKTYLAHYGRQYKKETGRSPTNEVYARIHNGGPDGWRERATWKYWTGVRAEIDKAKYAATWMRGGEDA